MEHSRFPRQHVTRMPGAEPDTLPLDSEPKYPRQIASVPEPAWKKPTDRELFTPHPTTSELLPNPSFLKQHFFREGRLTEPQALSILEKATDRLAREPNLVDVASPVTICGDIHGQYYDLMKLFDVGGSITENSYLFLGDYVDRGSFGIECLIYLYSLKLWYPNKFVLLRGNHECRHLTEYFTFKRECVHKYSERVYDACIRSFCALPLAAVVDKRFFCVHGGISPSLITLNDIVKLDRFQEPGGNGLLCDLLWSDPIHNFGHEQDQGIRPGTSFLDNAARGCSYFFTYEAACQFLERNNLLGIIRGHEAQDAGYTMHRKTPRKGFPAVITIFSAPNYLDVYHNRGAVIKYANKNITIRQYNSSSHPYWLPNFMDAFTWSLPFVGAKIAEMLLAILQVCTQEELEDDGSDSAEDSPIFSELGLSQEQIQQRKQEIKTKILAVGKMQRVFQLLREEAENASELEAGTMQPPSSASSSSIGFRIGPDALGVQGNHIRRTIQNFEEAKISDQLNERLPDYNAATPNFVFPVPSMRVPARMGSDNASEPVTSMEALIKRTLMDDENLDDGGVVERIADRIARGRRNVTRPQPLKRFETDVY